MGETEEVMEPLPTLMRLGPGDARRMLTCDQVAWMLAAIDRYLPAYPYPGVSRAREMAKYGLLYELMDVASLCFVDHVARLNGTPSDVRVAP